MVQNSPIELQKYLAGVDYPATRDDLLDCAEENDAPDDVVAILEELPDDLEFASPADVMRHFGPARDEAEAEGEEPRV